MIMGKQPFLIYLGPVTEGKNLIRKWFLFLQLFLTFSFCHLNTWSSITDHCPVALSCISFGQWVTWPMEPACCRKWCRNTDIRYGMLSEIWNVYRGDNRDVTGTFYLNNTMKLWNNFFWFTLNVELFTIRKSKSRARTKEDRS